MIEKRVETFHPMEDLIKALHHELCGRIEWQLGAAIEIDTFNPTALAKGATWSMIVALDFASSARLTSCLSPMWDRPWSGRVMDLAFLRAIQIDCQIPRIGSGRTGRSAEPAKAFSRRHDDSKRLPVASKIPQGFSSLPRMPMFVGSGALFYTTKRLVAQCRILQTSATGSRS